ncbi:hypothetical protein LTR37_015574 [Vermiconidia calcicola]|uniref:Uncharacterized protein n=1 Tax=Vermiconidia calcicola TaxID=1690605 RepID=A0ACC3MQX1_9PEZI|nr:hypothetical protein LTR37_015574 [Vermiconidia calcicola]
MPPPDSPIGRPITRQSDEDEPTSTATRASPPTLQPSSLKQSEDLKTTDTVEGPSGSTSSPSSHIQSSHTYTSTTSQPSSSTIHLGSATTAQPLPSAELDATSSTTRTSGFPSGARKAVIATTTIGGTVLLLLLFYMLWRRRKGATYSQIVCFRPRSPSTVLLTPRPDERLTALPIYHESRFSIRSSRIGSTFSLNKAMKRPSGVPANVAVQFHNQHPWVQSTWKTPNLPTPTGEQHPLAQCMTRSSSELKPPEMARVYSSHGLKDGMKGQSTEHITKSGVAVEVRPASPAEGRATTALNSANPLQNQQERWSWTNSQAPPTPRMYAPSWRSSLSSQARFIRVKSWVRNQAERQNTRIDEESARPPSRRTPLPAFKNKASKPTLAPRPTTTRKQSKSSARKESLSLSIQIPDAGSPARPKSAKLRGP